MFNQLFNCCFYRRCYSVGKAGSLGYQVRGMSWCLTNCLTVVFVGGVTQLGKLVVLVTRLVS